MDAWCMCSFYPHNAAYAKVLTEHLERHVNSTAGNCAGAFSYDSWKKYTRWQILKALLYLYDILCECDIWPLSLVLALIVNDAFAKQVWHSFQSLVWAVQLHLWNCTCLVELFLHCFLWENTQWPWWDETTWNGGYHFSSKDKKVYRM